MKRIFLALAASLTIMVSGAPTAAQLPDFPPEVPGIPFPEECEGNLPPLPDSGCTLEVWQEYLTGLDEAALEALDAWWMAQGLPDDELEPLTFPEIKIPGEVPDNAPVRGAFYYPWYPENWGSGSAFPQSHFTPAGSTPTGGYYNTADAIPRQVDEFRYAKFKVAISSWYRCLPEGGPIGPTDCNPPQGSYQDIPLPGDRSPRDERFPTLLNEAALDNPAADALAVAPYYELEANQNPTFTQIRRHLGYLTANYTNHPNYLKRCDTAAPFRCRPVIFVYHDIEAEPCDGPNPFDGMVERWKQANTQTSRPSSSGIIAAQFHVVFKVFAGYQSCITSLDLNPQLYSFHQYGPGSPVQNNAPQSYAISPGFWHHQSATPLGTDSERDLVIWRQNIRAMLTGAGAAVKWQLVTTYNEWQEGTGVEPDARFGTAFLDALATDGVEPALQGKIAGAGDIACRAADSNNNGIPDGEPSPVGTTGCWMRETSDMVIDELAETTTTEAVLALGDTQYEDGETENYGASYDPTWGRFVDITYPTIGNHEYNVAAQDDGMWGHSDENGDTIGGDGYFDYYTGAAPDPAPGPRRAALGGTDPEGVYTWSIGDWLFISLNGSCNNAAGGCSDSSDQYDLAEAALLAHRAAGKSCEVMFQHFNRFSDGQHGNSDREDTDTGAQSLRFLYRLGTEYGVELFLTGHEHDYQRFAMVKDADVDLGGTLGVKSIALSDPEFGMRPVVIGTGGRNSTAVDLTDPGPGSGWNVGGVTDVDPLAHNSQSFGIFDMTLRPDDGTFTWTAATGDQSSVSGEVNSDTFNTTCHF